MNHTIASFMTVRVGLKSPKECFTSLNKNGKPLEATD
jgi:hypothetical protein